MSDSEDNPRKSDYEMGSGSNDEDEDDPGIDDDENNEIEYDETDDGNDDEAVGSGGYGDNEEDDSYLPPKRARFDSNSDDHTANDKSSIEAFKVTEKNLPNLPIASRMMAKMGHIPGKGLGKDGQGIVEPVALSEQKGTTGFGYRPKKSKSIRKVDPEVEGLSLEEHAEWLINAYPPSDELKRDVLKTWMNKGPEKLSYDQEYLFCEPEVLDGVLEAKNNLDDLDKDKIKKSRARANPFETLRGGIFLNRAAMKMANMDYVFDYMFTNPKDQNGIEIIGPNDLLYFADVCAGPGGFSEYVFFRKKWKAKGFGFTLREKNNFKLEDFFAGPSETFEPHYGVPIKDDLGDGDIFKPENITEFCSFVKKNTDGQGVHFMMADGGFSIDEKSYQEIISKQLYLCQCLVALKIVRDNGNFVVKLFDLFTRFSVGLVYLMYRSFERISIHKPNSSRPANSERYLICQNKRGSCEDVADYLFYVNELLCKRHIKKEDVIELVPFTILKDDKDFYDYIVQSNNRLGKRQTFHLKNIIYYNKFPDLSDARQKEFKEACLKLWQVPNEARTNPHKGDAKSAIRLLGFSNSDTKFLSEKPEEIDKASLEQLVKMKDWYWAIIESEKTNDSLTFYLGLGRTNVYKYVAGNWVKFQDLPNFQLPAGTLVYGETVRENIFSPKHCKVQYHVTAFHIVDGLFLGHEDIRNECILYRNKCCKLFAKALSRSNMIYRVKELHAINEDPYRNLHITLSRSVKRTTLKNRKPALGYDLEKNRFIVPGGLLFFPRTNDNWKRHISKNRCFYYFNTRTGDRKWESECLDSEGKRRTSPGGNEINFQKIFADFETSFSKRHIWWLKEKDLEELAMVKNPSQD